MSKIYNYLFFGKDHVNEYPLVEMAYLDSSDAIRDFLGGDIQYDARSCSEWIDVIEKAERETDFFHESFANCCTITITSNGVTIENEYTKKKSTDISLQDMHIILQKWLEQLTSGEVIEYSWNQLFN
jgi:hypothetical protein